jgi:hypothetical protein
VRWARTQGPERCCRYRCKSACQSSSNSWHPLVRASSTVERGSQRVLQSPEAALLSHAAVADRWNGHKTRGDEPLPRAIQPPPTTNEGGGFIAIRRLDLSIQPRESSHRSIESSVFIESSPAVALFSCAIAGMAGGQGFSLRLR